MAVDASPAAPAAPLPLSSPAPKLHGSVQSPPATEQAARHTLDNLRHVLEAQGGEGASAPEVVLKTGQGIAVFSTFKGAAGIGYEMGAGMIVKVLGHNSDGTPRLSAPLFVKASKLAIGMQLGVHRTYHAVLLDAPWNINAAINGDYMAGADADYDAAGVQTLLSFTSHFSGSSAAAPSTAASTATAVQAAPAKDAGKPAAAAAAAAGTGAAVPSKKLAWPHQTKAVTVSESLMVCDFSVYGGTMGPDTDLLEATYGEGATAQDVLNGIVPVPIAFVPVYAYMLRHFFMPGRPAEAEATAALHGMVLQAQLPDNDRHKNESIRRE